MHQSPCRVNQKSPAGATKVPAGQILCSARHRRLHKKVPCRGNRYYQSPCRANHKTKKVPCRGNRYYQSPCRAIATPDLLARDARRKWKPLRFPKASYCYLLMHTPFSCCFLLLYHSTTKFHRLTQPRSKCISLQENGLPHSLEVGMV
jgi:hypothetical protein